MKRLTERSMTTSGGRRRRSRTALAAFVAALAVAAAPARATDFDGEPFNDTPPWAAGAIANGQNIVLSVNGTHIGGRWTIDSPGDVDYLVLSCNQGVPDQPTKYVASVGIRFTHAVGDLDIFVMPLSGLDYLDYSAGTTDQEVVVVPGNWGTVVMKVYGYNGATGPYTVDLNCRT